MDRKAYILLIINTPFAEKYPHQHYSADIISYMLIRLVFIEIQLLL